MNKDFRNFKEALKYATDMRKAGFKSYVEEFCDFDGIFYCVLVWS